MNDGRYSPFSQAIYWNGAEYTSEQCCHLGVLNSNYVNIRRWFDALLSSCDDDVAIEFDFALPAASTVGLLDIDNGAFS